MIQFEYYNANLLKNTALKFPGTVGQATAPEGYAFGVLSALTNLETVSSTLVQGYNAVLINTLNVKVPTESAVVAYVASVFASDVDGITITHNASQELQAIGLINKNSALTATNPVYDWVGTQQEYVDQNVASLHPDWLCFITDDAFDPQSTYEYDQATSAATWSITHNLNKFPSVTVVDSAGTAVEFKVTYINSNSLQLEFNSPFKGTAYLN